MKHVSLMLCLRYLRHRRIVLLSVLAVALSCSLLIVTDSLFNGFINAIETSFTRHMGDIVLEVPPGSLITDYDILIERLEEADVIEAATAVLSSNGLLLSAPGKVRPAMILGIELPRRFAVAPLEQSLVFQKNTPAYEIGFGGQEPGTIGGMVGIGMLARPDAITDEYNTAAVAEMLGRRMTLTTGSVQTADDGTGTRLSRKVIRFNLTDVVMTGMHEFDQSFVLLPIKDLSAALYPDRAAAANILHIRTRAGANPEHAKAVVYGIWRSFAQDHLEPYTFGSVRSSKEIQAHMIREYRKQMNILLMIFGLISMGIILLVFCIFYLIVMTRRKDIGILKSCGLSSGSVAGLFVAFGTVVGSAGATLGIGLGWLITSYINPIERAIASTFGLKLWQASTYFFTQIPNTVNWDAVVWITAAGIGAAAIGSLIPAVAAARVRPVETLQYE